MTTTEYIDGRHERLDPADRGLAYGDGLFETMTATDGRIRWLPYHLERLATGCERLSFPRPDAAGLTAQLRQRLPATGEAIVKLILTRGSSERGYRTPANPRCRAIIFVYPGSGAATPDPVAVSILETRLAEHAKLAGIKHLCRLEQVLAGIELHKRGLEDGVLLSTSGNVICCLSSNLFVVHGSTIRTPRLTVAGIAGVMRRVVIEAAAAAGMEIVQQDLSVNDLEAADELFQTNAVIGVRGIRELSGRELTTGWTEKMRRAVTAYESS